MIYICPYCGRKRKLVVCNNCNKEIKYIDGYYDFLDDIKKYEFDEIGINYYQFENKDTADEIARCLGELITSGNVLDLGCGDGFIIRSLIKYDYNNLIGIDISSVMLEGFLSKLQDIYYDIERLTLIRANAEEIPLVDGSIDLVIVNNLFHLLENPKQVMEEINRILSPNGKLVLISELNDNYYKEFGKDLKKYNEIINKYNRRYWLYMQENNYFPNKVKVDFNPYLEANNMFKSRYVFKTKSIEYKGAKTILDFINKQYTKSEYSKSHIPTKLHLEVHNKVVDEISSEYGNEYLNIEINYKGKDTYIFDIYGK